MPDLATEQHYSVNQLAKLWGCGSATIRRVFADLPGVIRLGHLDKKGKGAGHRRYISLFIPESVMRREHARITGTQPTVVSVGPPPKKIAA